MVKVITGVFPVASISFKIKKDHQRGQNNMKWVDALQEGDIIDVVAPGFRCSTKEFKDGIKFLKEWGFRPRVSKKIFGPSKLFSNSDEQRFLQLKAALSAKDSKAVWCLRGGYGSIRLLEDLKKMKRPTQSKFLLGYSDITSLHEFLLSDWKWVAFHSPLLDRLGRKEFSTKETKELKQILLGEKVDVEFNNLKVLFSPKKRFSMKGEVHGGNMTVLQSSMGTEFQMKSHKGFVFFEDIGERPHRVDRMIVQMSLSGAFDNTKAILLGDFLVSKKFEQNNIFHDVWIRFAKERKIPVIMNMPVGHGERQKLLPLGTPARLDVSGGKAHLVVSTGVNP